MAHKEVFERSIPHVDIGTIGIDAERGLPFSHANHALDVAIEGTSAIMGRTVFGGPDLRLGRLVKPFDIEIPAGYAFYLVAPPDKWDHPNVAAFRNCMLGEIRADGICSHVKH